VGSRSRRSQMAYSCLSKKRRKTNLIERGQPRILCCRYTSTKIRSEALTDKEEACELRRSARVSLAHLSSDPKYSNALPLRLRAACVPHALRPTDEFDAPSVRKDTQPESTRMQPPQGVPTFQPREYRASSPRFACALELGSK
jgi:hypothetical protein